MADGIHSLSDLVADFVVLFGSHHGKKDADQDHPYGHQRFETAASLALGALLLAVGIGMLWSAGYRAAGACHGCEAACAAASPCAEPDDPCGPLAPAGPGPCSPTSPGTLLRALTIDAMRRVGAPIPGAKVHAGLTSSRAESPGKHLADSSPTGAK